MSTDPRNEIFDLELKEWDVPPGGSSDPEHTPNFLEPGDNDVRLSRDYDLPPRTLRVTNAGSDDPNDQRVYERTFVPVYDPTFEDAELTDPRLLHVREQQQKTRKRFASQYPAFATNFDNHRGSPDDPDGAAPLRNPRLAPNADGNLLWSFMFSNKEPRDVPTGIDGPNPWLTLGTPRIGGFRSLFTSSRIVYASRP